MAKVAHRNITTTRVVEDGDLYNVFLTASGRRAYPGPGVPLGEATRLAESLLADAEVRKLDA